MCFIARYFFNFQYDIYVIDDLDIFFDLLLARAITSSLPGYCNVHSFAGTAYAGGLVYGVDICKSVSRSINLDLRAPISVLMFSSLLLPPPFLFFHTCICSLIVQLANSPIKSMQRAMRLQEIICSHAVLPPCAAFQVASLSFTRPAKSSWNCLFSCCIYSMSFVPLSILIFWILT